LRVLRSLAFRFLNLKSGRCDPSLMAIARDAGVGHATVSRALDRLERAGIIERDRRAVWVQTGRRKHVAQDTNCYRLFPPQPFRAAERQLAEQTRQLRLFQEPQSERETRNLLFNKEPEQPISTELAQALLGLAKNIGWKGLKGPHESADQADIK
jgi:DNA-binding transcriptional MocR family regulator